MDISTVIFLVILFGSYVIRAIGESSSGANQTGGQQNNSSLSDIRKYLEEMSGENRSPSTNTGKAQSKYTEPYGYTKPKQQRSPSSQRGFNELLDSLPPIPENQKKAKRKTPEAVQLSSSTAKADARANKLNKNAYSAKKGGATAVGVGGFNRFNLPSHLNDIQKAIVVTEILGPPKSSEF